MVAKRAALGHHHQQWNLEWQGEGGQHIGQRGEAAGLHEDDAAGAGQVGAGNDAHGLLLARRVDDGEVIVGMQSLYQRREYLVGHVGDEAHLVGLEDAYDDGVPGFDSRGACRGVCRKGNTE